MKSHIALFVLAGGLVANPAGAGSIKDLAGLEYIRVYEATYITGHVADFAPIDARLTAQLTGTELTGAQRDFGFYSGDENYDVFFSNADGTLNANGSYLTIEGNCGVAYNCFNISGVALVKTGNVLEFADTLASAVYGRAGSFTANSAVKAVDNDLSSYTQLGDTIGLGMDARMRITVGFASTTPPVPEPSTWAMLLAGLGLVGWQSTRRRKPQMSAK